jgi:hypothetical protein
MLAQDRVLFGHYTLRVLDNAEFDPLFRQYRPLIFQTMLDFDVQQALSIEEQTATARLRERMGTSIGKIRTIRLKARITVPPKVVLMLWWAFGVTHRPT